MSDQIAVGLVRVDQIRFHPHNVRHDLGDLRGLANSIAVYGVMQPVVVEKHGGQLRLRAGHRRVAAAKIAGLNRIPAVIHAMPLDDIQWIEQSVQENVQRAEMDHRDRARAIQALRRLGCSWHGIAGVFDTTAGKVKAWAGLDDAPADQPEPEPAASKAEGFHVFRKPARPTAKPKRVNYRWKANQELIRRHQAEYDQIIVELQAEAEAAAS